MTERIHVCVAWPYVNGDLHLGHLAGAYIPCDIFARYQRLRGREVLMVSGSDTHGTPITVRAEEEGITPREVVDRYHPRDIEAYLKLGVSFDLYTETDTENHWAVTQDVFLTLLRNGYIYRDVMDALYCDHCKRYLPDRYVEGTCPYCGNPSARGDQCDKCGRTLDAVQLLEPRCRFCGHRPRIRQTEHFFLDLPKLRQPLLEWLSDGKEHWRPNVLQFTLNMLNDPELRGRPITRDIPWGIPVPVEGFEEKRIYVWFDAVIGYLAATKEWAKLIGEPERWRDWWQDKNTRSYYFIGKDNIPFHTVIWPGMLIGYGNLNLPYDVPANEYLTLEERTLSKSRRWVIEVLDFLSRYDPDTLRYILSINMPETRDTNFSWGEYVRRTNDELVATYGNLVHRTLSFAQRNFEGRVPEPGELSEADAAILARADGAFQTVGDLLDGCKFKAAITEVMAVAHDANRYLDAKAPWFQIKTDRRTAATTIYTCLCVINDLKVLLAPFLPFSSQRLHRLLGYDTDIFGRQYTEVVQEATRSHLVLRYDGSALAARWEPSRVPPGQKLPPPTPLFSKVDESIVEQELARMSGGA
ncbi:MAG: methionine--tRNA ligase [Anaerolineae bacterium]|nr:methionine--tRNA ligase [Anaerolineae bacterium]